MKTLMEWGIVSQGDTLEIAKHDGSDAEVVDNKTVRYGNESISFNKWGQMVTGWPSINIYDWAMKKGSGKTLAKLREERMAENARGENERAVGEER